MPVGEVNHFRASFYSQHAHARQVTIQKGLTPGREKMPFEKLRALFDDDSGGGGNGATAAWPPVAEEPLPEPLPVMVGGGLQENGANGNRK